MDIRHPVSDVGLIGHSITVEIGIDIVWIRRAGDNVDEEQDVVLIDSGWWHQERAGFVPPL
jgi:hypothetical protein